MSDLIIVRHGRTAANATGLLLGRADPDLDELGLAQDAAVGVAVAAASPGRVLTSPLARARATAAAIAAACGGLDVIVDERWLELDYGEYDQMPLTDIPADTWLRWRADPGWAPPGGESLAALGSRVRAACAEHSAVDGPPVVVVTHVSPVKAAAVWALGVGDEVTWRMFVAPASVTRIGAGRDGAPSLRSFNETAHLP